MYTYSISLLFQPYWRFRNGSTFVLCKIILQIGEEICVSKLPCAHLANIEDIGRITFRMMEIPWVLIAYHFQTFWERVRWITVRGSTTPRLKIYQKQKLKYPKYPSTQISHQRKNLLFWTNSLLSMNLILLRIRPRGPFRPSTHSTFCRRNSLSKVWLLCETWKNTHVY